MAPRIYAVLGDLIEFTPQASQHLLPEEPEATRLLKAASRRIEVATKTAYYVVDDNWMPTDPDVLEILRDATCAQALWWAENAGTENGTATQWNNVAIGSVRLARGSGGASGSTDPNEICQTAGEILESSGLLPGIVFNYH